MKSNNIKSFSGSLEETMKGEVDSLHREVADPVIRFSKTLTKIGEIILRLRKFVVSYEFQDTNEEIHFFKEIKPLFLAQYYYYARLLTFKENEPALINEKIRYYLDELGSDLAYSSMHSEFHYYCVSGTTTLDDRYFVRGNIPCYDIVSDREFSTAYDEKVGRLMSGKLVGEYIGNKLKQFSPEAELPKSPLKWTANNADLIELIYGLETMGVFNKGKADIKEIATLFEAAFNISLGNYYRQFLDIRQRKRGNIRTIFLKELQEKLESRINNEH